MLQPFKPSRLLALGLVLALATGSALADGLRAYFDRSQVHEGDTLTLTIEKAGVGASGSPDLAPLAQDFDVLGTSNSTQIRIVNGVRSDTTSWQVSLAPKRSGVIEVPAIALGADQTAPLTLEVEPAPQGALGSPGDEVFIEVELGDDKALSEGVMVQQQVPLTVWLFSARPLLGGDLSEPKVDNAVVAKLGDDRQYQTQRQGRTYQVIERRYSLSPEQSGALRIPPIVFKGTARAAQGQRRGNSGGVFDNPGLDHFFQDPTLDRFFGNAFGGRDPFGMFERGEPVRAQSKGMDLTVKARPEGLAGAQWLPAQGLTIADSWTTDPPQLRVGEPVTRTLTLTAEGLAGAQIPEVGLPEVDGLRIYPEKAEAETRTDGAMVFGVSRQTFTLIPSRDGALTIPEVNVTWWDTKAQQERTASLPAWHLQTEVGSADVGTQPPLTEQSKPQAPADANSAAPAAPSEQPVSAQPEPSAADPTPNHLKPQFLAGLALVVLGIIGAVVLWRRHRLPAKQDKHGSKATPLAAKSGTDGKPRPAASPARHAELSGIKRALREACEANDPQRAGKALLSWAEVAWPEAPPRNLGALAIRIAPAAVEPLKALEHRLYACGSEPWEGKALWEALQDGLVPEKRARAKTDEDLAPLYPHRS